MLNWGGAQIKEETNLKQNKIGSKLIIHEIDIHKTINKNKERRKTTKTKT